MDPINAIISDLEKLQKAKKLLAHAQEVERKYPHWGYLRAQELRREADLILKQEYKLGG